MKVEMLTKHDFTIGLYINKDEATKLLSVCNGTPNKNHCKLNNDLDFWFYCDKSNYNSPFYSVAIFNKGRKIYYGGFHFHIFISDLNSFIEYCNTK